MELPTNAIADTFYRAGVKNAGNVDRLLLESECLGKIGMAVVGVSGNFCLLL